MVRRISQQFDNIITKWSNRPRGYATLNGDPAVANLWQSFTIPLQERPVKVILFSDGFIRLQGDTARMYQLAPLLFQQYDKGGLADILTLTRTLEQERAGTSHEAHAEATAIAFEFTDRQARKTCFTQSPLSRMSSFLLEITSIQ